MLRLVHLPLLVCSCYSGCFKALLHATYCSPEQEKKALTAALFPPHLIPTSLALLLLSADNVPARFHHVELQMFVVRSWQWSPWDAETVVWTSIRSLSTNCPVSSTDF